jgi:hypothetical protein
MTTFKPNRLTKAQNFKLYEWAKEKCSEGALHGMTDKAVAEIAGSDLDFVISESSVADLRTDPDIPITWRTSKEKAPELPIVDESDMRVLANTLLQVIGKLNAVQIHTNIEPAFGDLLTKLGIEYFAAHNGGAPLPMQLTA